MSNNEASIDGPDDFKRTLTKVEEKIGKTLLIDEDFLLLACSEISKTYTRDEKNYT
jgi:hypothetical protein